MELDILRSRAVEDLSIDVDAIAALIVETQLDSGEIPWCKGHKTDPWDHVEAAMGLGIGGYLDEARRAFEWFARTQLDDGSCYSSYRQGVADDKTRETNLSSYIAVGVYHYYMITRDTAFLKKMWPPVSAAIEFALRLQTAEGEIYWAISPEDKIDKMALLTGASSVYMSIKCGLAIAKVLGHKKPSWRKALGKLKDAIQYKPHLFNITKSRYSMDWFYPVLSGVLTGPEAQKRIDRYWKKFVIEERGVKCVFDEPWVTIAETSELVLTLAAMDRWDSAQIVLNWISDRKYEDGSYWSGFTFPEMIIWPEDRLTWTNAVALMAADAVYSISPASQIFNHQFWNTFELIS